MADKVKLTKECCQRCSGGGEVLSSTVAWSDRCEGAFAVCPTCKGAGRITPLGLSLIGGVE